MATMVSGISSMSDKDAGNDALSGELTSLLMRLQDSVVHVTPERDHQLRTSEFERTRVERNLAYARDLFSQLEQSEHSAHGPARRMSIRGVLGAQEEMLDLLYDRLEDLKQMAANAEGEEDDSEEIEDLLPNYAPPPKQTPAPIPEEDQEETHILPPPTAKQRLPEPDLLEPWGSPPNSLPPPPKPGPPMSGPPKDGPPRDGPPMAGPPKAGPPQAGPPRDGPPMSGPPKAGPPKSTPTKAGARKASNRSRYIPVPASTANADQPAPESPPAPPAPIEPPVAHTQTTQTLRNRNEKKSAPVEGASYTTARAALFAGRSKPSEPQTSTATAEAILDHQRQEQDALSESILKMASALKESSKKFSVTLDEDKEVMAKAGESVEKTERSMESARGRMGTLRKMTEGKGWWGRMILYAWVYGLMVGLVLLVFVFPKLRF